MGGFRCLSNRTEAARTHFLTQWSGDGSGHQPAWRTARLGGWPQLLLLRSPFSHVMAVFSLGSSPPTLCSCWLQTTPTPAARAGLGSGSRKATPKQQWDAAWLEEGKGQQKETQKYLGWKRSKRIRGWRGLPLSTAINVIVHYIIFSQHKGMSIHKFTWKNRLNMDV